MRKRGDTLVVSCIIDLYTAEQNKQTQKGKGSRTQILRLLLGIFTVYSCDPRLGLSVVSEGALRPGRPWVMVISSKQA